MTAPALVPVMVGTAGHVDHGKTALAQHLTGCELDRLPESKARGMTIDLGFAPCRLPGNRLAGLVDVPGHEDFIKNMVAGAAVIDVLLLVVAADDGVMPQTREHLRIVSALGTPCALAAVTKCDLVDEARRDAVCAEVRGLLAAGGWADAPVLPVSNVTMDGIPELRRALEERVAAVVKPEDARPFRMHVERVFSVAGFGTVVTGIPLSGRLAVGAEAELLPAGTHHGVRSVQNYRHDNPMAIAGVCTAINLRDLDPAAVQRGMTLGAPAAYAAVDAVLAHLRSLPDAAPLKRISTLRLHVGTAAVGVRLKLLDTERLEPGSSALARLALEAPLALAAGDRCVLRAEGERGTVAGGVITSVRPGRCAPGDPGLVQRLGALREALTAGDLARAELLGGDAPVLRRDEARRLARGDGAVAALLAAGHLLPLGDNHLLVAVRREDLRQGLLRRLDRQHRERPQDPGLPVAQIAADLGLDDGAVTALAAALGGDLRVEQGRLRQGRSGPVLTARQRGWYDHLLAAARAGGLAPPALGPLLDALRISESDLKPVLRALAEQDLVHRIGPNLVASEALAQTRAAAIALLRAKTRLTLADFRAATGCGRNLAVALLERLDAEGLTRRDGDARIAGRPLEG